MTFLDCPLNARAAPTLRAWLLIIMLVVLTICAWPLKAADKPGISRAEAAQIARKAHGGEVLRVRQSGGEYRIRLLLDSGRIRQVIIDAETGAIRSSAS